MLSEANLREVVRLGIALSAEKDKNLLFGKLLRTAMEITGCDAGTLYLFRDGKLHFKVMKTLSQGVSRGEQGEPIDLPPVALREENVCAFSALHRELINIPDVYHSDRFDFSGPRRYDAMTGYRTGSMLVVPLEDAEGELIGVLQLINKLDKENGFIRFTEEDEFILQSLGSMTAVSLSNMLYVNEIKAQMFSFVQAFATAVDERTPYNGTHTRKVTIYAELVAEEINRLHREGRTEESFDEARREQLVLAAALHDIGKMIVPLAVMNKATRLDERLETVRQRFRLLDAWYERDALAGRLTEEEAARLRGELAADLALIEAKNSAGFLPDEDLEKLGAIAKKTYEAPDGTQTPYLTEEEARCLLIRKGTLTDEERKTMESHVVMTDRILSKVRFNPKYAQARRFAATHHELLNGRGYPSHLTAEELPLESRILTVVDVFDALTCTDRPYKKPIPRPKAFAILRDMAKNGQIEERLVDYLENALADVEIEDVERMAQSDTWGSEFFA
ncbi:MAG: GAF domain-containing protein [Oscillospiraceae bacterium]|nr:GAF domain-containing protein [Oscillospiraceae bacterium]